MEKLNKLIESLFALRSLKATIELDLNEFMDLKKELSPYISHLSDMSLSFGVRYMGATILFTCRNAKLES